MLTGLVNSDLMMTCLCTNETARVFSYYISNSITNHTYRFGNVWRFPQLAADYGGGAFLIPYIIALFIIGIPILFLEISLGQFHQTGDVGVFGSIHARLRGVGLSSVACAYMLVTYVSLGLFYGKGLKESELNA